MTSPEACRIISDDPAYRPYCVTHDHFIRRCSVAIEQERTAADEAFREGWIAAGRDPEMLDE